MDRDQDGIGDCAFASFTFCFHRSCSELNSSSWRFDGGMGEGSRKEALRGDLGRGHFLSLLLFLLSVLILREVDCTEGGRASKHSTAATSHYSEDEEI